MVDISDIHASDDLSVVERTGPQLFSWCGPYSRPATTAICYWTLPCQTLVHIVCVCVCVSMYMCVHEYKCVYVCVCMCAKVCVFYIV